MNKDFNESEHPRDDNGKFTDKDGNAGSAGKANKTAKSPRIDKREYSVVCSAVMRKQADYKYMGIKRKTFKILTSGNFYVVKSKGYGNFEVITGCKIVGNEDLIDYLEEKYGIKE